MKLAKTWMLSAALLFAAGLSILSLVFVRRALEELPSASKLEEYVPPLVTQVIDTNGLPVGEFFTERRTTIPLTQIPVDLRNAVMAVEDTDFYQHWGINPKAILRAMIANTRAGRVVQGGSTLTQQLAKTIFLTRRKTLDRKFKELLLTLQIEKRYSKDEILQLYLNQIYFGGGAYGVEAAARLYFDKHAQELNLPECALLAGLIRSPNYYSPFTDPERAKDRRATILRRMQSLNFISPAEEEQANRYPILEKTKGPKSREALYFLEEIRKILGPVYGEEMLEQGGLTIQTTLDLNLQRAAESVLEKHLADYDIKFGTATLAEYNRDLVKNTTGHVEISTVPPIIQGALVAIDVHTGAIRAMVGGRDFVSSQFNRAVQAKRQPGSSFKPFVWATVLENNFTPATIVNDYPLVYSKMDSVPTLLAEPTTYAEAQSILMEDLHMNTTGFDKLKKEEKEAVLKTYWAPQNFDGKYMGPMTIRKGLQKSRNLVSIRLVAAVGPHAVSRMARLAGIKHHLSPVLSLGLGTSVVSLLEMANAFGTFASGGFATEPYYVERVTDHRGSLLQQATPKVEARVSPQTAFLTVNIMRGVIERGTGWYARRLNRPLGGKTGTTQDQRDLLFVGFSADLACGVWVGYDDFRPLKKGLTASAIAVPLWTEFMREALKGQPVHDFPVPPKIEYAKIDADTGYLALSTCPKVILEAFKEGTVPSDFCPVNHAYDVPEEEAVE